MSDFLQDNENRFGQAKKDFQNMTEQTTQPDTCIVCGSMSLRLLKDRVTNDPILSPEGMKIYRCERCKGFSNES